MNTRILVVGLGNELLGDDGVGVIAAWRLRDDCSIGVDVIDCNISGVGLLDVISGYNKVIFIDAIRTRQYVPGTVLELDMNSFRSIPSDSPHHTGLAELINISKWLEIDFPDEIAVIAVEVEDGFILGAGLSETAIKAIDPLLERIKNQVRVWNQDTSKDQNAIRQQRKFQNGAKNRIANEDGWLKSRPG